MGVRRMTAAVVVECGDELGECPVWDPAGRSCCGPTSTGVACTD